MRKLVLATLTASMLLTGMTPAQAVVSISLNTGQLAQGTLRVTINASAANGHCRVLLDSSSGSLLASVTLRKKSTAISISSIKISQGLHRLVVDCDSLGRAKSAQFRVLQMTSTSTPATTITTSGHIRRSETWQGLVTVTGDLSVDPGVTLTLLPGTRVEFTAGKDDSPQGGPLVNMAEQGDLPFIPGRLIMLAISGRLIAEGTPAQPITFTTTNHTGPQRNDWHGLNVLKNGSIKLRYAIIEWCYLAVGFDEGQQVDARHVVLRNMEATGFLPEISNAPYSTQLVVEDDLIDGAGHEGIESEPNETLIVRHTIFLNNQNGIHLAGASIKAVEDNLFLNNHFSILFAKSATTTVRHNVFSGDVTSLWLHDPLGSSTITENNFEGHHAVVDSLFHLAGDTYVGNNWWGSADTTVVEQYFAGFSRFGVVKYLPIQDAPLVLDVPKLSDFAWAGY